MMIISRGSSLSGTFSVACILATLFLLSGTSHAAPHESNDTVLPESTLNDPIIAVTEHGAIRGKYNYDWVSTFKSWFGFSNYDQTSRMFLGIPFADPPVGKNRFRAPQPFSSPWGSRSTDANGNEQVTGVVKDMKKPPAPCMQNFFTTGKQSEDCLFLNVFVPPKSRFKENTALPVMVWWYGGAFWTGDAWTTGMYNARYVTDNKDVIVVIPNFRMFHSFHDVFAHMHH